MAVIKITNFGGIAPSVDPRRLSAEGAQVAQNLDLRFGDFRPTKGLGASVATVPAGTRSIFRTPSGVWLTSTTDTHYVNGQIPDAASERVYLTGRSAYPEAWQGGVYRRLGVPAPSSAPTVEAVTVAQFDESAASEAQIAAATAVVEAIKAIDTQVYLGNAVPASGGAPPAFDPDYAKVQLHLSFDALSGGQFVDQSPQQRATTKDASITLLTDNTGPLGVAGAGCGLFGAGHNGVRFSEIRRWRSEADPTWCIEWALTAASTRDFISIQSRDYNIREIVTYQVSGSNWGVLSASQYGGVFNEDLRCKRPDGSAALTAGVPAHVRVQCTGSTVEVWIDGVLCGTVPYALGLEVSCIGDSTQHPSAEFVGKMDECRVTFGLRNTGAFSPPTTPHPTSAVPTGTYLAHGALSTLPTDSGRDAAYLVQLVASGGGFTTVNAADAYLRVPPFVGSQVTYSANPYWAVQLKGYRADGLAATAGDISTAIAAVTNPAGGGALLTAPQVAALAPLLADAYDASKGDLLVMVTAINTAQAELRTELARAVPVSATVAAKVAALTAASDALTAYYAGIDARLRAVLAANEATLFGSITSQIVTRDVQTRTYIVTYLTDWDEESAPSPASDLLSVDQNDAITVTVPAAPAGRNIVGWRLYRSASSSTGASWALVADPDAPSAVVRDGVFIGFSIANRVYSDSQPDEKLQEPCETITWAEPPEDLQGLVGMPNGIMVGFFGKTLCFSVPWAPYAWPVEYQLTVEHDIVAIGVFGQTAVVVTKGFPVYVSGADSASMSAQKVEVPQSCIAARSVATVDGGVIYASPDGLCLASASGIALLTQGAFDKADWMAAVSSAAVGAFHDGSYYLYPG